MRDEKKRTNAVALSMLKMFNNVERKDVLVVL